MGTPLTERTAAKVARLLRRMGARNDTRALHQTISAVSLCLEEPERLTMMTKWLYPDVAKAYQTNWHAVERNIRYMAGTAWAKNPTLLSRMAGHTLPGRPTSRRFLMILSEYCTNRLL